MILPGKHLAADRCLLGVGADILSVLEEPLHVSEAWDRVRGLRAARKNGSPIDFQWFTLAIALLYALGAIEADGAMVVRGKRAA